MEDLPEKLGVMTSRGDDTSLDVVGLGICNVSLFPLPLLEKMTAVLQNHVPRHKIPELRSFMIWDEAWIDGRVVIETTPLNLRENHVVMVVHKAPALAEERTGGRGSRPTRMATSALVLGHHSKTDVRLIVLSNETAVI